MSGREESYERAQERLNVPPPAPPGTTLLGLLRVSGWEINRDIGDLRRAGPREDGIWLTLEANGGSRLYIRAEPPKGVDTYEWLRFLQGQYVQVLVPALSPEEVAANLQKQLDEQKAQLEGIQARVAETQRRLAALTPAAKEQTPLCGCGARTAPAAGGYECLACGVRLP